MSLQSNLLLVVFAERAGGDIVRITVIGAGNGD